MDSGSSAGPTPVIFAVTTARALLVMSFAVTSCALAADNYPSRPIRFIVPFPPGGGTDIYARIIGPKLAEALRQQVVVDNRPGAAGALGAELAARAPADGYTIWIGQTSNLAIVPVLRSKNTYDPIKDFAPITLVSKAPQVLVVNADSPVRSIKDLIAAAKSGPAGKLTYATAGVGSAGHIAGEMLKQTAGIDPTHVPYKGASPAMIDLRGGRLTYMVTSLASAAQFVREGRIRAIGTTGAKRAYLMPDVPTVAEQGFPGFESISFLGILAPARTPRAIVDRLNREIVSLMQAPEVQKLVLVEGGEIVTGTPEDFTAFLRSELPKWAGVIKRAGITAD
jgi:tripartite-type tricarboxylate transporter receptor subunit TctC